MLRYARFFLCRPVRVLLTAVSFILNFEYIYCSIVEELALHVPLVEITALQSLRLHSLELWDLPNTLLVGVSFVICVHTAVGFPISYHIRKSWNFKLVVSLSAWPNTPRVHNHDTIYAPNHIGPMVVVQG